MVSTLTFLKGHGLTRQEELEAHKIFKENIDRFNEYTEPVVPFLYTQSNLPLPYHLEFSPLRIIQQKSIGKGEKLVRLRVAPLSTWNSMIEDNMVEYVKKIGPLLIKEESVEKAKQTVKEYSVKTKNVATIAAKAAVTSILFYGVQNMLGLTNNYFESAFPYIPDIVVGTIPFYSVQKLERGMSDRILKYRAIGDIFLAHQRGSTDTLRVDLTLVGPYRNFYLLYLLSLQQKGESSLKELENIGTGIAPLADALPTDIIKIPSTGAVQYEAHATFPIITQTAIMLDMFLQTIEWHQEKDRGGHEVVYTTLLFRKHIDPQGYTVFKENDKLGYLDYGNTQSEKMRKELLLDTAWKIGRIGRETLRVGLFGGDMFTLDREAIASDPYVTNIKSLVGGFSSGLNNADLIFGLI